MRSGRWALGWAWVAFVCVFLAAFGRDAGAQQKPGAAKAPFTKIYVCVKPPNVQKEVIAWSYVSGNEKIVARPDYEKDYPGTTVYVYNPSAPAGNTKFLPIPYNTLPCDPVPDPPPAAETPTPPKDPKAAPKGGGGSGNTQGSGSGAGSGSGSDPKKKPDPDEPPPGVIRLTAPPPFHDEHSLPPKGGVTENWPTSVLPYREPPPERSVLPTVRPCQPGILPFKGVTCPKTDSESLVAKGGDPAKNGKGEAKTPFEKFAENIALAGGLANLQLGEDIHDKDGHKYGVPGGKNPDGIKSATAQAVVGTVAIAAVVITAAGADKKILAALHKDAPKKLLLLTGGGKTAEEAAEKIIQDAVVTHGANAVEDLAAAMANKGAIGEYSVMAKFTKGLGSRWQAHHILEVKMAERFGLGATDRLPAVILSDAEHKAITKALAAEAARGNSRELLWEAYVKVYGTAHPTWLKAIASYFGH